ncbi:MAG: hypothetical protein K1Y02_21090 [Candidatus Hydrogenedentes bacterium]|nr:hypothetical protein [Candidatus Hydrogenedentota bacterium]
MPTYSNPSIRFFHSRRLRTRTLRVLEDLEQSSNAAEHGKALGELVVELTQAGMSYFFLTPMEMVKMKPVVQRSAKIGLSSMLGVMCPIVKNVIGHMDDAQLRKIAQFIRTLM